MNNTEWGLALVLLLALAGMYLGPLAESRKMLQHCSLTGTYIIDDDTVIVCRVVKRGEPNPVSKKPEEQSL